MWGPMIYGLGPLAPGESKGLSRKGRWPELKNIRQISPGDAAEDSLVLGRPKAPLRRGVKKRYKNKFVRRSKISWGKLSLLPFQIRLHLTEPYSAALSTIPNNSGIRLMGQISVL